MSAGMNGVADIGSGAQFYLAYRAWILSGRSGKWATLLISAVTLSASGLVLSMWFAWWMSSREIIYEIETENHVSAPLAEV